MSDIVLEWAMLKVVDHSKRVWKNENFKAGTVASTPVNVRAFLLHQIFHMRQWGIIFQIDAASPLPNLPAQQANKSSTLLGITQQTPNNVKTISQRSRVIGQCNRRWLTDSPPDLHMQHQSKMSTFLFLRLSMVRILPSAAVQVKKSNSGWNFDLPNAFPWKYFFFYSLDLLKADYLMDLELQEYMGPK